MNVLQVTADSVRADLCGWQPNTPQPPASDGADEVTPTLTDLAADSLTFTTAVAPGPRTLSSVPVTHTGVPFPPTDHDTSAYEARIAWIRDHIERFETVSQTLRDEGYTTLAFTANPWTSVKSGFDAGFDEFVEVGRTGGHVWAPFEGTPVERPARLFDRWLHDDTWFCQWRTFYDDIVAQIEAAPDPVFAWVFLIDPHNPYLVPRPDRSETTAREMYPAVLKANRFLTHVDGRTAVDESVSADAIEGLARAYRDCVRSVDTFVGRLLSDLDSETMLVFHSDHGEAFGEHGQYGHSPSLYEENVRVPALVHGVGRDDTVGRPFSTAALPDLIRSYARGADPDPTEFTTEFAVSRTEDDGSIALHGDRWKYIQSGETEALYDLRADSGETDDVSSDRQAVLEKLRGAMRTYLDSLPEVRSHGDAAADKELRRHLDALGYL